MTGIRSLVRLLRGLLAVARAVPAAFADRLAWRLAWRNAWRNPRRTGIVTTAVAVGIGGVVLTMAVNYGMVFEMVETAIAVELGHVQVHAKGFEADPILARRLEDGGSAGVQALAGLDAVRAWAPRVRSQGLVFSPRASVGVRVVGIDPDRESEVSLLARSLVDGEYLDGTARRLLVGEGLARRLSVGTGDKVVLSVQDLAGDLTGEAYRVGGLFRTPSRDLDRGTVFLRIDESQRLLGLDGAISELVVLASRRDDIPGIQQALRAKLGDQVEVRTWEELQPLFVYLVESFDSMAWIVYAAVFIGMAFGIANVLLMAVYERMREFGIQMAIGMRPSRLVAMVVLESVVLTFVGLAIGLGAALLGVWALGDGIDLSRFSEGLTAYGIPTRIRPVIRSYDIVVPSLAALLTAVASSLWPALHAVRFRPAEAVRHV
jgi:ABC-type lipoprotein release transport system permease subunit